MKFKIDTKKFEKALKNEVNKIAISTKIELECPNCKLYCWDYSMIELEKLWEIYCNNCDTKINITLENNIK